MLRHPMVYLDNAASTRPSPQVREVLAQANAEWFANPSSAHGLGADAARRLERAREQVAALIGAEPREVVFTSGGTEADALGVMGAALAARGRHIVVAAIEHPAVLRSAELLVRSGFTVSRVAPAADGVIQPDAIARAIMNQTSGQTAVVAVMLVNNELGTLQPVTEIVRAVRAIMPRVHFHVDAVQAAGVLPVSVKTLGADSLAISAHKIHGPKGAGALWLAPHARIEPLWGGGGHERNLRSGTANLPAWLGLGVAAEQARAVDSVAIRLLRDRFEDLVLARLPHARPTVPRTTPRAPHIASFLVPDLPGEPILHALEHRGVYAAAGSACASRERGPSHVLKAIGIGEKAAVLRFSLSRETTAEELDLAVSAFAESVAEVQDALPRRKTGTR